MPLVGAWQRRNSHGDQFPVTHKTPSGELHEAKPTFDPALLPAPTSIPALSVAGHQLPRLSRNTHFEQQLKKYILFLSLFL